MAFGIFADFAKKVLDAAKKGGLNPNELQKLDRLLTRDGKRNKILAAGLVSALKTTAGPAEVEKLGTLFEKASERIADGKQPFTKGEAETMRSILKGAGVSTKTTSWVSKQIDDLLADEIKEFISGKKIDRGFVPTKKKVSFAKEEEEEKKKLAVR
ncbi:MAG: hypothetical protein V1492_01775 [Candidatus Micrarchaeota archaeon]